MDIQSFTVKKFDDLSTKMDALSAEVDKLKESKSNHSPDIDKRISDIEKELYRQQQYSRRDCIEITGIPENIADGNALEAKSIEILKSIDVPLRHKDISACHRLPKGKVIIKFINRKDAVECLKVRKKMKTTDKKIFGFDASNAIYINESLCPTYKALFYKCNLLYKDKKIKNCWTYNGTIKVRLHDDKVYNILHQIDLENLCRNKLTTK